MAKMKLTNSHVKISWEVDCAHRIVKETEKPYFTHTHVAELENGVVIHACPPFIEVFFPDGTKLRVWRTDFHRKGQKVHVKDSNKQLICTITCLLTVW